MKTFFKYISLVAAVGALSTLTSCNDYLDQEPGSFVSPNVYFNEQAQLQTYIMPMYMWLEDYTHKGTGLGTFSDDAGTDNLVGQECSPRFVEGAWTVTETGDLWNFENITTVNYFFDQVLPKYEAGKITGSASLIKQNIGEAYFFRAFEYFTKLKEVGDFPIVDKAIDVNVSDAAGATATLKEISKRQPRNQVARFILNDLDSAVLYLSDVAPDGAKNQLSKNAARVFQSRVALFEGTWLNYFKGTAFVPGGEGWPGKDKYEGAEDPYKQSGSIDEEVKFFLNKAKTAAQPVADAASLTPNTGVQPQTGADSNPYFTMFGDQNLAGYNEVLLWRSYNAGLGIINGVANKIISGSAGNGVTRDLVMSFLDIEGKPYYASKYFTQEEEGNMYLVRYGKPLAGGVEMKPEDEIPLDANQLPVDVEWPDYNADVNKPTRDYRISSFLQVPYTKQTISNSDVTGQPDYTEVPNVHWTAGGIPTGYLWIKGGCLDGLRQQKEGDTGSIIFRSTEAMLNYMEADCMLQNGTAIDGSSIGYWSKIRERSGVMGDYTVTLGVTDMAKEFETDWAVKSANQEIEKLLFLIRKERRHEFACENLRKDDLRRWRAMDHLKSGDYIPKGMFLWPKQYKGTVTEAANLSTGEVLKEANLDINVPDSYYDGLPASLENPFNWSWMYLGNIYSEEDGCVFASKLKYQGDSPAVSAPESGPWLLPYEAGKRNGKGGYKWYDAEYLSPLEVEDMTITAEGNDVTTSPIYQNPGWQQIVNTSPSNVF